MSGRRFLMRAIAFAGAILCAALATRFGALLEAPAAHALLRVIGVLLGVVLTLSGNFLPKLAEPVPARSSLRARRNAAERFTGWLLTAAGIGVIAIFLFAPVADAPLVAGALGIAAFAAAFALALWERAGPLLTLDPPTE